MLLNLLDDMFFAAIPAVLAYNRFARDIDRIACRQETFVDEFTNILQRNLVALAQAQAQPPNRA